MSVRGAHKERERRTREECERNARGEHERSVRGARESLSLGLGLSRKSNIFGSTKFRNQINRICVNCCDFQRTLLKNRYQVPKLQSTNRFRSFQAKQEQPPPQQLIRLDFWMVPHLRHTELMVVDTTTDIDMGRMVKCTKSRANTMKLVCTFTIELTLAGLRALESTTMTHVSVAFCLGVAICLGLYGTSAHL